MSRVRTDSATAAQSMPPTDLPARLSDIVRYWSEATPAAPALQDSAAAWNYARLWSAVEAGAGWLRELGVRAGDRVMVVGENCAALAALIFAAAELDAWVVVVNARLARAEIDAIREHCGARRTLYTIACSPDAAAHAERHGAAIVDIAALGRLAVGPLNTACAPEPAPDSDAEQVAALVYTTGTTGHPKGVMLTHRNLLFVAAVSGAQRSLAASDRVYGVLPISHVYGLASVMLATLRAGACLQLAPRYAPEALLDALRHDGVTMLQGVPAMYARLLDACRKSGAAPDASRLRFIYAGGSPLDPTLKRDVEKLFGKPLHNGYGMTETAPSISQTRMDAPRADTSVGHAIPGVALRIVDSMEREVRSGEIGELWVRGPNVMKGYYREPALTAAAMRDGGWLNTGDMARQDPDGALFIVGRSKELIIRSGFNVYPAEVEAALNSHPAVSQSAVVGRRAADGNEEVVAFVELGAEQEASVVQLQAYLSVLLAPYKRPSEIIVMQTLPAAATGKLLKGRLRDMAQRMRDQAGNTD
jgi:acyl-CoA synthetase (AMP-forming)/AMP-acid ligase II